MRLTAAVTKEGPRYRAECPELRLVTDGETAGEALARLGEEVGRVDAGLAVVKTSVEEAYRSDPEARARLENFRRAQAEAAANPIVLTDTDREALANLDPSERERIEEMARDLDLSVEQAFVVDAEIRAVRIEQRGARAS